MEIKSPIHIINIEINSLKITFADAELINVYYNECEEIGIFGSAQRILTIKSGQGRRKNPFFGAHPCLARLLVETRTPLRLKAI